MSATCPSSADAVIAHSPVGPLRAGWTREGLAFLHFEDPSSVPPPDARGVVPTGGHARSADDLATRLRGALEAYFAAGSADFAVPLAPEGTPFQHLVWRALLSIPAGQTRSYADVARMIGRPAAVRAVARANATNPIAILIPCHRVIGSDGTLTGYGGGLDRKRWLLDHERAFNPARTPTLWSEGSSQRRPTGPGLAPAR